MTQTYSPFGPIPHRPHLRDHAEKLLAAYEAAPSPQTHADILRAARTLMALDRLVTQLWSEPGQKTSKRRGQAQEATSAPEIAIEADEEITVPPPPDRPPNRQERRAQAARERQQTTASPIRQQETAQEPRRETG